MPSSGTSPLPAPVLALDTSAYSQLRRGHPVVLDWVGECEALWVPWVVLGELEAGFRCGRRYRENRRVLDDFLGEPFVRTSRPDRAIGAIYGEVFAGLRAAGTPIPTNDIWIAAEAMAHRAHLVTFDSDFERVNGLERSVLPAPRG